MTDVRELQVQYESISSVFYATEDELYKALDADYISDSEYHERFHDVYIEYLEQLTGWFLDLSWEDQITAAIHASTWSGEFVIFHNHLDPVQKSACLIISD